MPARVLTELEVCGSSGLKHFVRVWDGSPSRTATLAGPFHQSYFKLKP